MPALLTKSKECSTPMSRTLKRLANIFGCEGEPDSLKHYIRCDPFWTLLFSATNGHSSLLSSSPAQRICLVNPGVESISRCVVAFQAYHALRNNHSSEISSAVSNSDFAHIALIACDVLIYFAEAIGLR